MFNLARQAFTNPFVSINPFVSALGQQAGWFGPNPYAAGQMIGLGQINPLAAQIGVQPFVNPFTTQLGSLPTTSPLSHPALGGRFGGYGVDPRFAFGTGVQQPGYTDPNLVAALINPQIAPQIGNDPIASQWSQQLNPLYQQQQLPIRPLIGGQQGIGSQAWVPGIPTSQGVDPYRTFVEAQLICQLANNALNQLQRTFAGVPEAVGMGVPFGVGQQFNPLFANTPFYGY
jgi:hypothetical protein